MLSFLHRALADSVKEGYAGRRENRCPASGDPAPCFVKLAEFEEFSAPLALKLNVNTMKTTWKTRARDVLTWRAIPQLLENADDWRPLGAAEDL